MSAVLKFEPAIHDKKSEGAYADENLALALALAAAGLPIFPARVIYNAQTGSWDKKPYQVGWREQATTDEAQLRDWWSQYPNAVPGIELEKANLIVIDSDRHGGTDGVAALNALAA